MRASRRLWLLVAVACGRTATPADEPPELEPLFVSGERLRARVADAGTGARRLLDWYDTVLETTCTFRPMEDGVYRCVPAGDRPWLGAFSTFGDDACSVAIDTQGLCPGGEGSYLARELPRRSEPWSPWPPARAACGSAVEDQPPPGPTVAAYRYGSALPAGQAAFTLSGGQCMAEEVESELYELEALAPESLVAATRRFEARGDALFLEILVGDDGSRTNSVVYDSGRKRSCAGSRQFGHLEDYRCFALNEERAADEGCEQFGVLAACEDELLLVPDNNLPFDDWLHRLGERIDTERVRRGTTSANCDDELWPLPEGRHLYEAGPRLLLGELPGFTTGLLGSGRARVAYTRGRDDAQPLFVNGEGQETAWFKPGPFWDSERAEPCDWQVGADDVTRCFPSHIDGTRHYAASDCSDPLVWASSPARLSPTLVRAFPTAAEMCATEHLLGELFVTAERATYDHYFVRQPDGTCERFEGPHDFFETVEVDLDDFVEVTVFIE